MSQYSWTLVADNDGTNCVLIAGATNDEFVRYVVCKVSGKQKLGFRTETRPVNLSVIDAFGDLRSTLLIIIPQVQKSRPSLA